MRRPTVVLVVSLCAGAAAADGDKEWIDVRDLVPANVLRLRPDAPVSPRPLGLDASKSRRIAGEDAFLTAMREGDVRRLDADSLTAILSALPPTAGVALEFDATTGALGCPAASAPAVAKTLADVRTRAPGPVALRVAFSRDGATLLRAEGHVTPGAAVVFADATERSVVADYNVEIAQAASIGDPILATLRSGASAEVCVTPLPDGRSAVVEAVARSVDPQGDATIDVGHPGFGAADRCETAFAELATTFRAANGRPCTVAWTGLDGARMALDVDAAWTAAPPPSEPAVVVSPFLGSRFGGFRTVREPAMHDDSSSPDAVVPAAVPEFSAEALLAAAFHDPAYAATVKSSGTALVLPASESRTAAQQFARLCAAADAMTAEAQVDCVAAIVPEGAQLAAGAPMPAGAWIVATYSGPALRGLPACCTGGTERRYLSDWDVEVAQSARIPDPRFEQLATGHFLDLDVGRDAVSVHLDLRRLERIDRREMALAVGRASQGVQAQSNEALLDPALPPERVAVEKPVVAQTSVAAIVPLGADGTGSLRRASPALFGVGRELVVAVRIR
jgi:hypothetical protein